MTELAAEDRPALRARALFIRYVVFAVAAALCNLASQEATARLVPSRPLMASVLVGTGFGFVVKYVLDKRWIFFDDFGGHASEFCKVVAYGLFSIGTTLLFWGLELGAWQVWHTAAARYAGAVVGLALGNWIKYLLDRHYVFGTVA